MLGGRAVVLISFCFRLPISNEVAYGCKTYSERSTIRNPNGQICKDRNHPVGIGGLESQIV